MRTLQQRLSAVVGKCFQTQSKETASALKHAVISKAIGREIKSSNEVTDAEAILLLEQWGDGWTPSENGKLEIHKLAREYQQGQGVLL